MNWKEDISNIFKDLLIIFLKYRVGKKKKERDRHSVSVSVPKWPRYSEKGQAKIRRQEILPGPLDGFKGPTTKAIFCYFPTCIVRECIRTGVADK